MVTRQQPRRNRRAFIIAALVIIVLGLISSARFYTDLLWFQEVGFTSVLWRSIQTQVILGLLVGVVTALIVWVNLWVAGKATPAYPNLRFEVTGRPDPLERYRVLIAPFVKWIKVAVAVFIGISAGVGAASSWRIFLLWLNRSPFGLDDPQFGKDVGFYVFELPFLQLVFSWIWVALFAALIFSVGVHYFQGSIKPESGLAGISSGALAHISVLLGGLALVKAGQYWLGQYELNFSSRGVVDGASYTDVNAQLPALKLLAIISIISALLFLVNIRVRRFTLPIAAVGIWVLTAFLAGFVWPTLVQRFSVEPQELARESEFIARNIEFTREGYGLTNVDSRPFTASSELTSEEVIENESLLSNIRLWDPAILQRAYSQLQAIRPYYRFQDVDIDRYQVDGELRQVLLAARELSIEDLNENAKTWTNVHLSYTHGYGLVASLANESTTAGQPRFLLRDLPGTPALGAEDLAPDQGGIYYGEIAAPDEYSIVHSGQEEIDFETDEGTQRSNYEGEGGVELGGFFKRLAFAIREGDQNLLLSSLVTGDSRIMIYKNVRDRVRRAAPFLALDNDPYVVSIDGRLIWVLDGYTHTNHFPYSQREDVGDFISTEQEGVLDEEINYLRNSVKITVDAYDGTMKFYIIDDTDPMVRAWSSAFPALFTEDSPPTELIEHFRYPEDLFKIQSELYRTYHMGDPADFYEKQDEWGVPEDPVAEGSVAPTYLLFRLPGETEDEFMLARPFTPRARRNMVALMAGRSDPGHYGELVTLEFPRDILVPGPVQVDNFINQDTEISPQLTLLRTEGSNVEFGRLITLPIEDTILYAQPIFVTAENVGIPELKKVALVFGEEAVMGDTFEEALTELFDLDAVVEPTPSPSPTSGGDDEEEPPPSSLRDLIERASRLYERAQQALSDGDFELYGRLIEQLGRLLERADEISG